jgi:hypothetical protein
MKADDAYDLDGNGSNGDSLAVTGTSVTSPAASSAPVSVQSTGASSFSLATVLIVLGVIVAGVWAYRRFV